MARKKTPIGIVGYIASGRGDDDAWVEKGTGSGHGGHALVMCLKDIGSISSSDVGTGYYWDTRDIDTPLFNISEDNMVAEVVRKSAHESYGSGYTNTEMLLSLKDNTFPAANAAKTYTSLLAPLDKSTGWFLPSLGQFYAIWSQLGGGVKPENWTLYPSFFDTSSTITGNITNALSKVGPDRYTKFCYGGVQSAIWTSSEKDAYTSFAIMGGGWSGPNSLSVRGYSGGEKTIYSSHAVRPFLAF